MGKEHQDHASQNQKGKDFQNEGEGSRSAAHRFNDAQKEFAQSGKVDKQADAAKKAFDGAEGKKLRDAEQQAKQHGKGADHKEEQQQDQGGGRDNEEENHSNREYSAKGGQDEDEDIEQGKMSRDDKNKSGGDKNQMGKPGSGKNHMGKAH